MSLRCKALLDRVFVTAFVGLWTAVIIRLAPDLLSGGEWIAAFLGLAAGYLLADLLAGSVHWLADRFFEPDTPILGPMLIAPFREHHEDPLAIARHDFFEVSGNNAFVTLPVVALLGVLPSPDGFVPTFLVVTLASLTLALFVTNQFHGWAHAPSPPGWVQRLHATGLILTPQRHARHHRGRHDRAYCVTSGWLNPLLDRLGFFERLERLVDATPRGSRRVT